MGKFLNLLCLLVFCILELSKSSEALTCYSCRADSFDKCKASRTETKCGLPPQGQLSFCLYKEELNIETKMKVVSASCEQIGVQTHLNKEHIIQCRSAHNTIVEGCAVCAKDYCNNDASSFTTSKCVFYVSLLALFCVHWLRYFRL